MIKIMKLLSLCLILLVAPSLSCKKRKSDSIKKLAQITLENKSEDLEIEPKTLSKEQFDYLRENELLLTDTELEENPEILVPEDSLDAELLAKSTFYEPTKFTHNTQEAFLLAGEYNAEQLIFNLEYKHYTPQAIFINYPHDKNEPIKHVALKKSDRFIADLEPNFSGENFQVFYKAYLKETYIYEENGEKITYHLLKPILTKEGQKFHVNYYIAKIKTHKNSAPHSPEVLSDTTEESIHQQILAESNGSAKNSEPNQDPIDGGWSTFVEASECDMTKGTYEMRRTCTNPSPQNGGQQCEGPEIEYRSCPVDGSWGPWVSSLICNQQTGLMQQTRECNNPKPMNGGLYCEGPKTQVIECKVNGGWSYALDENSCDQPSGKKLLIGTCNNPETRNGGQDCNPDMSQKLSQTNCDQGDGWSDWVADQCSAQGYQKYSRECQYSNGGCLGPSEKTSEQVRCLVNAIDCNEGENLRTVYSINKPGEEQLYFFQNYIRIGENVINLKEYLSDCTEDCNLQSDNFSQFKLVSKFTSIKRCSTGLEEPAALNHLGYGNNIKLFDNNQLETDRLFRVEMETTDKSGLKQLTFLLDLAPFVLDPEFIPYIKEFLAAYKETEKLVNENIPQTCAVAYPYTEVAESTIDYEYTAEDGARKVKSISSRTPILDLEKAQSDQKFYASQYLDPTKHIGHVLYPYENSRMNFATTKEESIGRILAFPPYRLKRQLDHYFWTNRTHFEDLADCIDKDCEPTLNKLVIAFAPKGTLAPAGRAFPSGILINRRAWDIYKGKTTWSPTNLRTYPEGYSPKREYLIFHEMGHILVNSFGVANPTPYYRRTRSTPVLAPIEYNSDLDAWEAKNFIENDQIIEDDRLQYDTHYRDNVFHKKLTLYGRGGHATGDIAAKIPKTNQADTQKFLVTPRTIMKQGGSINDLVYKKLRHAYFVELFYSNNNELGDKWQGERLLAPSGKLSTYTEPLQDLKREHITGLSEVHHYFNVLEINKFKIDKLIEGRPEVKNISCKHTDGYYKASYDTPAAIGGIKCNAALDYLMKEFQTMVDRLTPDEIHQLHADYSFDADVGCTEQPTP